jgi:hypothetical protein
MLNGLLSSWPSAVCAQSVKLQLMPGKHHAQLFGNVLLHPLDCVVFEFHNLAALLTDKMVMMVLAGDFKPCLVFIEVALGQQLAFLEQFERPVNCGVTDVRIYFLYFGIEFFGADMTAQFEKNPGDIIAWRSGLEPAVTQARMEQFQPLFGLGWARTLALRAIDVAFRHDYPINVDFPRESALPGSGVCAEGLFGALSGRSGFAWRAAAFGA